MLPKTAQPNNKFRINWYPREQYESSQEILALLGANHSQPRHPTSGQERNDPPVQISSQTVQTAASEQTAPGRVESNSRRLPQPRNSQGSIVRRIPESILCTETSGQNSTNPGPSNAEQNINGSTLQDGKLEYTKVNNNSVRLVGKSGPQRCVSDNPHFRNPPEVPLIPNGRQEVSVSNNAIWSGDSPANVHQNNARSDQTTKRERDKIGLLSGRYSYHESKRARMLRALRASKKAFTKARLHNQSQKILSEAKTINRILRNRGQFYNNAIQNPARKNSKIAKRNMHDHQTKKAVNEKISRISRFDDFSIACLPTIPDSSAVPSEEHNLLRQQESVLGPANPDIPKRKEGAAMVVGQFDRKKWQPNSTDSVRKRSAFVDRCIKGRLGIRWWKYLCKRKMAESRTKSVIELPRTKDSTRLSPRQQNKTRREKRCLPFRQFNYHSSNKWSVQPETSTFAANCQEDMENSPQAQHSNEGRICTRHREHKCRLPKQTVSRSKGVESISKSVGKDRTKIRQDNVRPVCKSVQCKAQKVFLKIRLPNIRRSGRIQSSEMGNECIREPPSNTDQQDCTTDSKDQGIHNSSNPELAATSLVPNAPPISQTSATEDKHKLSDSKTEQQETSPTVQTTSRMETLKRSYEKLEISNETIELLQLSERKATQKSYQSAWKKFVEYCTAKGRNPNEYNLANAIDYLGTLVKVSPHQFYMARSAISTTWKQAFPDELAVGSTDLCGKLSKVAKEIHPQKRKRHSEWDVGQLLEFLKTIPDEEKELKLIAGKTAILIALASFWRPKSDLARIEEADVILEERTMYLGSTKPKEGNYKDVLIHKFEENAICPIESVKLYLSITKDMREKTKNLFITLKKPYRNASADTIGRWISEILEKAGLNGIKPHALRSASTSNANKGGIALDEILKRANWSTAATFKKFYEWPSAKKPFRVHVVNSKSPSHPPPLLTFQ